MIRQYHNCLNGHRVIGKRLPKRGAQGGDMTHQQVVTTPLGQRQSEKIGAALDPDALVGPHGPQRSAKLGFVPQPSLRAA